MVFVACAQKAHALGVRSPEEHTLAADGAMYRLIEGLGVGSSWFVEVGHTQPFGIATLTVDEARAFARRGGWGVLGSMSVVGSRLGREMTGDVVLMVWRRSRAGVALGGGYRSIVLDGFATSYAFDASISAAVTLTDALQIGYAGSVTRYRAFDAGGAQLAVTGVWTPSSAMRVFTNLAFDPGGQLSTLVGTRLRWRDRLSAGAGYASQAMLLSAFVSVRVGSAGVSVGASAHPVLGVTRRVWLRWGGP